jgi:hypothetical protein
MPSPRHIAILSAVFAAALTRLVPHPPNFTGVMALALFSGAMLPRRALAFVAPMAAMLATDLVIGFHASMAFVYLGVALVVALGWLVASRRSALAVAAAALTGSIAFFLLTNFGVWAIGTMYPHDSAGLWGCYVAALPFFRNELLGDLFYSALLFGGFALAERLAPSLRVDRPAHAA